MNETAPLVNLRFFIDSIKGDKTLYRNDFSIPLGAEIISSARLHVEKALPDLRFDRRTSLQILNSEDLARRGCALKIVFDDGKLLQSHTTAEGDLNDNGASLRGNLLILMGKLKWDEARKHHPTIDTLYDGTIKAYVLDAREERLAQEAKKQQENKRAQAIQELGIPADLAFILPDLVAHLKTSEKRGWDLNTPWNVNTSLASMLESLVSIGKVCTKAPTEDNFLDFLRRTLGILYRIRKDAQNKTVTK